MTRRGFLAALLAMPVFARLLPKPKPRGMFNPQANLAAQYRTGRLIWPSIS